MTRHEYNENVLDGNPRKVRNRKRPSVLIRLGLILNVNRTFMNNFKTIAVAGTTTENERNVIFPFRLIFNLTKTLAEVLQNGASRRKLVSNDFQKMNWLFLTFQKLIIEPKLKKNSTMIN